MPVERRLPLALIGLLAGLGSPLRAEAPLSAIDWLSQSVSEPAPASGSGNGSVTLPAPEIGRAHV